MTAAYGLDVKNSIKVGIIGHLQLLSEFHGEDVYHWHQEEAVELHLCRLHATNHFIFAISFKFESYNFNFPVLCMPSIEISEIVIESTQ
jgi:hypothetical protein